MRTPTIVDVVSRVSAPIALLAFLVLIFPGCSSNQQALFERSRASIQVGMTLGEALDSGLGEYLQASGSKNLAGASELGKSTAGGRCKRHVLEVDFHGEFIVRVYCDSNTPSAAQLVPARRFDSTRALRSALDSDYRSWSANLHFRVESPPRALLGSYDHYGFSTDAGGRVGAVSAIRAAVR